MSHGKLRASKDCLNCGHVVDERFCTACGQENTENKKPFHYLLTHFFEDFTHYDGQFWKTIKSLLFKPGELTKIYLSGKRQAFVPPVKLYIFVSFVTFFLSAVLPSDDVSDFTIVKDKQEYSLSNGNKLHQLKKENIIKKDKSLELINNNVKIPIADSTKSIINDDDKIIDIVGSKNLKSFDKKYGENSDISYQITRPFAKKYFDLKEKGFTKDEIGEKFSDTFMHTLPKALFIYLPIFAFFMWLFHNKKKWWYYDHGVFTLHYFSFLLITMLFLDAFDSLEDVVNNTIVSILYGLTFIFMFFYSIFYFFRAHYKVYENSKSTTFLKGLSLFIINTICLAILLVGLFAISFLMIH